MNSGSLLLEHSCLIHHVLFQMDIHYLDIEIEIMHFYIYVNS